MKIEIRGAPGRTGVLDTDTNTVDSGMPEAYTPDDVERMAAIVEALASIGRELSTQDNRITHLPVFAVQQRRVIYGIDPDYTDQFVWVDEAGEEVDAETAARLEASGDDVVDEDDSEYRRIGIMRIWEFVTACLTESACREYIRVNGHNLHSPRIYVYSGYRNAEWELLRRLAMQAAGKVCND